MKARETRAQTAGPSPFLLVPWQEHFLTPLLEQALEEGDGDLGDTVFIFPHSRPRRYLLRLIGTHPRVSRPLVLPECYAVRDLFAALRRSLLSGPAWNAGLLDRMGLLLECVRAEHRGKDLFPLSRNAVPSGPSGESLRFFPWATRLSALFEECFSQGRAPEDILYAEDQVPPFAASLLARISGIFARYTEGLEQREWTTPSFDAFRTAEALQAGHPLVERFFAGRKAFIAGFHLLTGTEEILFRHMWRHAGARVMLHADPRLPDGEAHWSCEAITRWASRWRASVTLCPGTGSSASSWRQTPGGCFPHDGIRYYQGYDLHSQLAALETELNPLVKKNTPDDNPEHDAPLAIILPDSGLLMPCLHHMPSTEINVSMGYPLTRSPLFRLLDTIFRLQEGRRGRGYYWRDVIEILRHPYLKMLEVVPPEDASPPLPENRSAASSSGASSLRRELRRLERSVRLSGLRFSEPEQMLETSLAERNPEERPDPDTLDLLAAILRVTITAFEDLHTPKNLGKALQGVCTLLLEHGGHVWERFLIDAECLYRLMESLIPELIRSAAANEPFTSAGLFALVRQILEAERVPFEADPLVGAQVMGLLESRLLTVTRVFLPDATEDRLPGMPAGDPLLPDGLRPVLGLPPAHSREQTVAYHFFRLLAGAKEVCLLWQEGGGMPGEGHGGKRKSRFVEELLWEEEKRRKRLFRGSGTEGPLHILDAGLIPLSRERRGTANTAATRALVETRLSSALSASFLDAYLRCPFRFAIERLLRLSPPDEVNEGDDPLALGQVFHMALRDFYTPHLGLPLPAFHTLTPTEAEAGLDRILTCLEDLPEYARLRTGLPADSASMLSQAARIRLARFLEHQPATTVVGLETTLFASLDTNDGPIKLTGRLDRLDLRPRPFPGDEGESGPGDERLSGGETRILDYKTGRLPQANPNFWNDGPLWTAMERWSPGPEPDLDLFEAVTGQMESVQLPLYLLLLSLSDRKAENSLSEAAWVDLADTGKEIPLFGKECDPGQRRFILQERIPALVRFLVRHMRETPSFFPRPGTYCRWCSAKKMCIGGDAFT